MPRSSIRSDRIRTTIIPPKSPGMRINLSGCGFVLITRDDEGFTILVEPSQAAELVSLVDDAKEVRRLKAALLRFVKELRDSNGRGISRSRVAKRLQAIHDCDTYYDVNGMLCNADGTRSVFDDVDR